MNEAVLSYKAKGSASLFLPVLLALILIHAMSIHEPRCTDGQPLRRPDSPPCVISVSLEDAWEELPGDATDKGSPEYTEVRSSDL